jgi:hypothetical protein
MDKCLCGALQWIARCDASAGSLVAGNGMGKGVGLDGGLGSSYSVSYA